MNTRTRDFRAKMTAELFNKRGAWIGQAIRFVFESAHMSRRFFFFFFYFPCLLADGTG